MIFYVICGMQIVALTYVFCALKDIENIHQSTVTRAFLFLSNNLATVSYLQVADIARPIRQVSTYQCRLQYFFFNLCLKLGL